MKVCSRCHKTLPDSDFHENGISYKQCNSCRSKKRDYYKRITNKIPPKEKPITKVIKKKKDKILKKNSYNFFMESLTKKQVSLTFCGLGLEDSLISNYVIVQFSSTNFNPFYILLKRDIKTEELLDFTVSKGKNLNNFLELCISSLKTESNKDYILCPFLSIDEPDNFDTFINQILLRFKDKNIGYDFMTIIEFLIGTKTYSKQFSSFLTYMNFENKIFEFENLYDS